MSHKALFRWFSAPGTRRGYVINLWRWKLAGQWKVGEDVIGNEYMLYQPFQGMSYILSIHAIPL